MVTVKQVTINYELNPVGVGENLQFGWKIESDQNEVVQTAYHLQIALDKEFGELVYDRECISCQSQQVTADTLTVEALTKYYVRVSVVTNAAGRSNYSKPSYFVTGLLDNSRWQGEFISAETVADAKSSKGTYVRKVFNATKKVKSAFVASTALGLYHLYLDGEKVGKDQMAPGWTSYHKHLCYQVYDVTQQIQEGKHVIAAMIGAGWYKGVMGFVGDRNNYGEQTAFLCQLIIRYTDGSEDVIVSDSSWQGADAPVVFSEIYDGEIYDARLAYSDFSEVELIDNRWSSVALVSYDKSVLVAQGAGRVQVIEEILPNRIFTTPKGDTVIDFGQNLTGWVKFKVIGKVGEKVEIACFEVLDKDGNVYLDNLRGAKQTLIYYCRGGMEEVYAPHFTFQGFQYAKVVAYPGEIKEGNFTAQVVHTKMMPTSRFECSNGAVNQLHHNILWGLKGNFLDVPTDCPQRNERLGWTGDAQIFCRTASYLMNTYTFFSKWLKDVAADQTPEGGVAHVVPDIVTGRADKDWLLGQGTHSAAAWADVATVNPWTMYLTYGDTQILEKQYESMRAWVMFMHTHATDGIWNYKLQFGDWVALDAEEGSYFGATPNDLTGTAYYAYSTNIMAKTAKVLGKEADAKWFRELYKKVVDTFHKHFFDGEGTLTAQTQTAHILALYFNLTPESYKEKTIQGLLRLLDKEDGHLVTGFVGTPYFCHALSQNGHAKEAYELLLKDDFPSWLYQVKMGATTVWEHWDGIKPDGTMWSPDMNSFNHYAYGAIGEWLYRVVAGIEVDEAQPGYKHSIIAPQLGGDFSYVRASFESIYGTVSSNWKVEEKEVALQVTVPPNTTATIYLDRAEILRETDGIKFEVEAEQVYAHIGSGNYQFKYLMK